jgi:cysteine desulfurase
VGIYLDWNATTPPHPDVVEAMQVAARQSWANPASVHELGRRARALVEDLREAIAGWARADPREVILTSGGTEANNLALAGCRALVTSRLEHPSVTRVAEALARRGVPVEWLPVGSAGVVDPADVARALERLPPGATVAVMAANHETGVLQPTRAIFAVARAAGARLHVDAVQAAGKVATDRFDAADSLVLSAHKIRGPKGIGALVWRGSPAGIEPLLHGGAQERGLRPGTVDPVAAAGFLAALRRTDPERHLGLAVLRDRLEAALASLGTVNGAGAERLAHVTNLCLRDWQADEAVAALDLAGVCISAGSACSAGTPEPSPVIAAMLGRAAARASIRVSLGEATSPDEVEQAIATMIRVLARGVSSP